MRPQGLNRRQPLPGQCRPIAFPEAKQPSNLIEPLSSPSCFRSQLLQTTANGHRAAVSIRFSEDKFPVTQSGNTRTARHLLPQVDSYTTPERRIKLSFRMQTHDAQPDSLIYTPTKPRDLSLSLSRFSRFEKRGFPRPGP